MCGIAVLVGAPGRFLDAALIRSMTDVVRHRGPDGEGFSYFCGDTLEPHAAGGPDTPSQCFAADHPFLPRSAAMPEATNVRVALGHRRLAIVDLSPGGYQPMASADRDLWIVYNGEIYNHVELRGELETLGHRFFSHSDTEVLLAAYRQWGASSLSRLNGMFAFAIVDRRRRYVFVARDRFGVKPLYYWRSPEGILAFASEVKQFTVLPGWQAKVNGQRAYEFLDRGLADHSRDTLFAGVHQLLGGEYLEISLDGNPEPRIGRWYELRPREYEGSLEDSAAEFRRLFEDSVRIRLRADVSVGSCLSGGLDSSSIVCMASRLLQAQGDTPPQKTFSARSLEPAVDEGRFMEEALKASRAQPHFVYPELDGLDATLPRLTWHQDEPFGSTSIYAQWHVFALAGRHGCKVMLDGQGADEALAGYASFFGARLSSLATRLRLLSLCREFLALRRLHGYRASDFARHMAYLALSPEALSCARRLFRADRARGNAFIDLARLSADEAPADQIARAARQDVKSLSLAQLTRTNLPLLLHWEDRNSMAHSVESRLPFLDYRLVEHVVSLPEEHLIKNGITKRVLRAAMVGILPERIRLRTDKIGFATPEEVWIRRHKPDAFMAWIRAAVEKSDGILTPEAVNIACDVIAGRKPFSFLLWRMISFGAWMERYAVRVT